MLSCLQETTQSIRIYYYPDIAARFVCFYNRPTVHYSFEIFSRAAPDIYMDGSGFFISVILTDTVYGIYPDRLELYVQNPTKNLRNLLEHRCDK